MFHFTVFLGIDRGPGHGDQWGHPGPTFHWTSSAVAAFETISISTLPGISHAPLVSKAPSMGPYVLYVVPVVYRGVKRRGLIRMPTQGPNWATTGSNLDTHWILPCADTKGPPSLIKEPRGHKHEGFLRDGDPSIKSGIRNQGFSIRLLHYTKPRNVLSFPFSVSSFYPGHYSL